MVADIEYGAPPLVSVVIPTHNRAEMARRAIQSALDQSWADFELIVVSDGSTDHTDSVMASFDDPRIRYLKHETARGSSVARNTGIQASRGNFLAFLDDDDEWFPRKLEAQVDLLARAPQKVGLIYVWIEYYDGETTVQRRCPTLKGDIFFDMLDKQAITNSSALMVRKEVFDVVGGFDERLTRGDDGDFIRRVAKHFEVDYIPEVLVRLHIGHADRLTVDSRENLKNSIDEYENRLYTFAEDYNKSTEKKANVCGRIASNCFKIFEVKKGMIYLRKIVMSELETKKKLSLLSWTLKDTTRHFLKGH